MHHSSIDWLQVVVPIRALVEARQLIHQYEVMGSDSAPIYDDVPIFSGRSFKSSARGQKGFVAGINLPEEGRAGEMWMSLPGKVCSALDMGMFGEFMLEIRNRGGHCTRMDVNVDDFDKFITPLQVYDHAKSGAIPRFRSHHYMTGEMSHRATGDTYYAGTPGSPKLVRVYDKSLESKGRINAIRWEVEYRAKLADEAFNRVCDVVEADQTDLMPQLLGGMVVGSIDFRVVASAERVADRAEMGWWTRFKKKIGCEVRMRAQAPVATLAKTVRFIERQAISSLAIIRLCDPRGFASWLSSKVELATRALKPRHYNILSAVDREAEYNGLVARATGAGILPALEPCLICV